MNRSRWLLALIVLLVRPTQAAGQVQYQSVEPPVIVVTGQGIVTLPPDEATIDMMVRTVDRSPARASAEDLARAGTVVGVLERLTPAETSISRIGFSVQPYWEYKNRDREFKGYAASVTVRVETTDLEATGRIVEAALDAGATQVLRITYASSASDSGRQEALRLAVAHAESDAAAMAEAAGGMLGPLLLLTTRGSEAPPGVSLQAITVGDRGGSSLTPEDIRIRARVQGRWLFIAEKP